MKRSEFKLKVKKTYRRKNKLKFICCITKLFIKSNLVSEALHPFCSRKITKQKGTKLNETEIAKPYLPLRLSLAYFRYHWVNVGSTSLVISLRVCSSRAQMYLSWYFVTAVPVTRCVNGCTLIIIGVAYCYSFVCIIGLY